jgi:hypothetical protein
VAVAALYPHGLFYATGTQPGCQHWLNYDRIEVRRPNRVAFYASDGRRLACLGPGRKEGVGVSADLVDDLCTMADEWAAHRALHDSWG